MSFIGSRTKKVTTYGKKRTGVVSLYTDQQLLTPVKVDHIAETTVTGASSSTPSASPIRTKRAPLKSKHSNENVNLPIPVSIRTTKKGSKVKVDMAEEKGFFLDEEDVIKKPSVPKKKKKTIRRKERFDGVELSMSKSSSRAVTYDDDVIEVTEDLSSVSLVDIPITPDHSADYDRLLAAATIPEEHEFNTFLSSPAVVSLLASDEKAAGPVFRKIGEASYSEVFAMTTKEGKDIVVKVIPLFDHRFSASTDRPENMPDTSYPGDVLGELEITWRMSEMPGGGFIDYLGSYVAKGKYPQCLIDEWWNYKRSLGSASVCPDVFGEEQRYALIVLSDGGLDLEMFKFDQEQGWKQAAGVFWQTVSALARAEEWTSFEHRDLHEGQILISSSTPKSDTTGPTDYLSPSSTGARATIIDFGLSRLDMPGQKAPVWSSFPSEVYEGKGEQWDVYRSLRDTIGSDWSAFRPRTNVLWLQYLVRYLLHRTKSLRRPKLPTTTRSRRARAPRKSDIVDEAVLAAYNCLLQTEERLASADEVEMGSAKDLLAWAKASGFLF